MVTQLDSSLGLMTFGQGFHRFLHVLAVEQDVQNIFQRHIFQAAGTTSLTAFGRGASVFRQELTLNNILTCRGGGRLFSPQPYNRVPQGVRGASLASAAPTNKPMPQQTENFAERHCGGGGGGVRVRRGLAQTTAGSAGRWRGLHPAPKDGGPLHKKRLRESLAAAADWRWQKAGFFSAN